MNFRDRLKKIAHVVKYRYLEWQWDKVLHKSEFQTWGQYFRYMDIDYNPNGDTLGEILHGYPYLIEVNLAILEMGADVFGPYLILDPIAEWCNLNTTDKYRIHNFHVTSLLDDDRRSNFTLRQLKPLRSHHAYSSPNSAVSEKIIVAFKNEDDAMMFTLVCS